MLPILQILFCIIYTQNGYNLFKIEWFKSYFILWIAFAVVLYNQSAGL